MFRYAGSQFDLLEINLRVCTYSRRSAEARQRLRSAQNSCAGYSHVEQRAARIPRLSFIPPLALKKFIENSSALEKAVEFPNQPFVLLIQMI